MKYSVENTCFTNECGPDRRIIISDIILTWTNPENQSRGQRKTERGQQLLILAEQVWATKRIYDVR